MQLSFFDEFSLNRIVNVASVPHRSPFRYPGGKTWLVPHVRKWIASLHRKPREFIEPFAGGGIISLTVAFEGLADRVTMVELDNQVAAVWKAVLGRENRWLASKILDFDLTMDNVQKELSRTKISMRKKAFITILRNRINHGGILAPGSGFIKNGENGKGIKSRWYPATLNKRITDIDQIKEKITFIEGDALPILQKNAEKANAVFFIDPPYTAAGKKAGTRLYSVNELDHEELFRITETLSGDFLMTYDNADGVRKLAERHGFDTEIVPMKNTHNAKMTELLIGRNLEWVRTCREDCHVSLSQQQ